MRKKDLTLKVFYGLSKEIFDFIAPLAALSSMAGKGGDGLVDNLISVYHVPKTICYSIYALAKNEGVRDFAMNNIKELSDILFHTGKNLIERPAETILIAGGVYLGTKYFPYVVRFVLSKKNKRKE